MAARDRDGRVFAMNIALKWASPIFRVSIAANLKSHRQGLVVAVDGRKDFNFDSMLKQLKDEVDRIDSGSYFVGAMPLGSGTGLRPWQKSKKY
jgi:hypothetical protein